MSTDYTAAFDAITEEQLRRKRGYKWSLYADDVLPSFVADMDFELAPPIHRALSEQLAAHDYGYTAHMKNRPVAEIFAGWAQRRFAWRVEPARIEALVDIVQGIYLALQLFSEPGDGVVTFTPTYPPLWTSVANTGRRLVDSTLVRGAHGFEIDFDRLETELARGGVRMLLLCNPHNPTGRVFTAGELERIAGLVCRYELVAVADEIHADLVYAPHRHIPFASLSSEVASRTITMTSATKSFNLGGLRFAIAIFGSEALQTRFNRLPKGAIGGLNSLGAMATEIAWSECDRWLDALVGYLQSNRDYVVQVLREKAQGIVLDAPQSTYLAWLDCAKLPLNESPHQHFLQAGKLAFSNGMDFGTGGEQCVRLNFATSRRILEQIVARTAAAVGPSTSPKTLGSLGQANLKGER